MIVDMVQSLWHDSQWGLLLVDGSSILELFKIIQLASFWRTLFPSHEIFLSQLKLQYYGQRYQLPIVWIHQPFLCDFRLHSCYLQSLIVWPVQFIWSDWKPESWEMFNEVFTSSRFVNIDSNLVQWYFLVLLLVWYIDSDSTASDVMEPTTS